MGFNIYHQRKRIIELSLVAGGTLDASTAYYVTGLWGDAAHRDTSSHTDLADEVNIATDVTNRSIQIDHYIEANIVAITKYDANYIHVESSECHGLKSGDIVSISGTTNYDGSWTIVYDANIESVDTPIFFRIQTSWIADETSGSWKCQVNQIGLGSSMTLRVSKYPAWTGTEWDATEIVRGDWTNATFSWQGSVQNYIVTSQPTISVGYALYYNDYIPYFRRDSLPKGITDYSRPACKWNGDYTIDQVIQACLTWIPNNCNYFYDASILTQKKTFYLLASLTFAVKPTTQVEITDMVFTLDGSMYNGSPINYWDAILWTRVNFRGLGHRRVAINGTFVNCTINSDYQESILLERMIIQDCTYLTKGYAMFYGSYGNILDGLNVYLPYNTSWFWYVYPNTSAGSRVKNLKIYLGYFYYYHPSTNCLISDDTYCVESVEIYSEHSTRDISVYLISGGPLQHEVLDVIAPLQTNKKPRLYFAGTGSEGASMGMYFTLSFTVVDKNGTEIEGALIQVTDKDGNLYEDTTDSNGEVVLKIRSYYFYNDTYPPTTVTETDFNPFKVTVGKNTYQAFTEEGLEIYERFDYRIALQPEIEYKEGLINADVEEDELTGVTEQDEVTGVVETQVIEADVEEDTIYAEIVEDEITGTIL